MSVTVVSCRRPRAGQEQACLARCMALIEQLSPRRRALHAVQLFQGLGDVSDLLYLARWESRDAYLAHRAEAHVDGLLDPLCAGAATRYFMRPWISFETRDMRARAVDCVLIESRPGDREQVQMFLLRQAGPRVRALPGLCYRRLYQDLDNPDRLMVCHGWVSSESAQAFLVDQRPALNTALRSIGATMTQFVGVSRAEFERAPAPDAAP